MKRTENKKNTSASLRSDDKMLNFFAVSAGYIVHMPFTIHLSHDETTDRNADDAL